MNDGFLRIMEGSCHAVFYNISSDFTLQKKFVRISYLADFV